MFIVCPNKFNVVSDLLNVSVMYSNGFNKHRANTTAKGHSELALHADSTGPVSPNIKGPLLLMSVKLPANPEFNGLSKLPSPSTGMCCIIDGRLYLSRVPALSP